MQLFGSLNEIIFKVLSSLDSLMLYILYYYYYKACYSWKFLFKEINYFFVIFHLFKATSLCFTNDSMLYDIFGQLGILSTILEFCELWLMLLDFSLFGSPDTVSEYALLQSDDLKRYIPHGCINTVLF